MVMLAAGGLCAARAQQAPATQPETLRLRFQEKLVIIRPAELPQAQAAIAPELIEPRDRNYASDVVYAGTLDPLVKALGSLDFAERQQATQTLLRLSPNRLPEVRSALARETNAEAVARLTQVAAHLFMKARTPLEGTSAIMGVMFNPEVIRPDPKSAEMRFSIAVMDLLPGYPAAQDLRVGDRLIAVDGQRFPEALAAEIDQEADMNIRALFTTMVSSHKPGSVVPFMVIRNGQQIEVSVQLAGLSGMDKNTLRTGRLMAVEQFTASLKTGLDDKPLILKDDTVPASILNESLEK